MDPGSLAMLATTRRASSRVSMPNRLISSLDHLVGKLLELRWHIKAECRGGLEVDYQIEFRWPLIGKSLGLAPCRIFLTESRNF
jgi:hypothetical protein